MTTDSGYPASSTSPPRSVRRTWTSRRPTASRSCARSTGRPLHRRGAPYEGQMVSTPMRRSSGPEKVGRVLRHETIEHSLPHSWRSGQPLIYMAVPSWFVAVTKIRDRMVELNQEINWTPEHIRDGQFGKWLGVPATGISAATAAGVPPSPCGCPMTRRTAVGVYGSLDELEARLRRATGQPAPTAHRRADSAQSRRSDQQVHDAPGTRGPRLLVESGSMPYAQVHYPFENREWFDGAGSDSERAESSTGAGSDSERAESNTGGNGEIAPIRRFHRRVQRADARLVLQPARALDCPLRSAGIPERVRARHRAGQRRPEDEVSQAQLSRRQRVFDRDGSDAMRWFLMASPILRGGNLVVTEQGS